MKKMLTLCFIIAMFAGILSACALGEKEQANNSTGISDVKDGEEIVIRYIQFQPEYQTAAITLANAYMEENPNVRIEVVTASNTYFDNLKTTLIAGEVPEIFVTEGYNNMKSYEEYITDLSDQPWVADIKEAAKACITLDDKIMGMPITMAGEGIVYNKKMFAEHGWEIPKTLSEFEELCKTIEAAGIRPLYNQFADDWLLGQFISAAGYAYIPDVDTFTNDLYAGTVTLADNEQMKNNLHVLDILLKYGQDNALADGWNEVCTAFAMEESAMLFEGEWIWNTIYEINPEIDAGMFAIPTTENPEDTKMIVDANGLWHVGKGSKNPEAAKEYLNWIATDEVAREIMSKEFKVVPVFEGWEYSADNLLSESTIEYMNAGMIYPWSWPIWPDGFRPSAGKVYQEYILGNLDASQTLQELDKIWTTLASEREE